VQESTLAQANQKMERIFGRTSDIFITPYGTFNDATLQAMNRNGLKILSAIFFAEDNFDQGRSVFVAGGSNNNANQGIYHLPAFVSYKEEDKNTFIKNSIESILATVSQNIEQYGYSVILFHPQDFMKLDKKGKVTETLDENEIQDLSTLIDSIESKGIHITSFSKILENISKTPMIPKGNGDTIPALPKLYKPLAFTVPD
jgi:peptidoglycan/xylan/chitin deacetylase (PgdA/CDA1 family)